MERFYLAAICAAVPGLGRKNIPTLLAALGGARQLWEASYEELVATGLVLEEQVQKYCDNRSRYTPQGLAGFCRMQGVRLMTYRDEDYPKSLKQLHDYPLVLYVKGKLPVSSYAMAIVGSRKCTDYGKRVTGWFSRTLTLKEIPIISGGARGVDAEAHRACLEVGGRTVVVLGCGIDVVYPAENKRLFDWVYQRGGALVTEFPPGVKPNRNNFPMRNRIIVGLAQGVIVTECEEISGAIITANIAADEGRDVYCVPGDIYSPMSKGCHKLIRQGAQLVSKPEDIIEDLQEWQGVKTKLEHQPNIFEYKEPVEENKPDNKYEGRSEEEIAVLKLLIQGRMNLSEIIEKTGGDLAFWSTVLLELQVANLVGQDSAQRYYLR